ncbi:hypothetical protein [Reichenbachiella sp. 5M10]|uniref:hypothetical protein n=1 Tax=Reichenbachiella sp. 5M10 TaxID=1889772 RepID=UPI00117A5D10|nr:hypothetical protein [Reichenbachiella sp. 5M10]
MNWLSHVILYPLSLLTRFFAFWRKRQFDVGTWKSVEFELPTVAILSIKDENTRPVLVYLSELFRSAGLGEFVMVEQKTAKELGLVGLPVEGAEYVTQSAMSPTSDALVYKGSPVLPMSESVSLYPGRDVFVLTKHKLMSEVRHQRVILVTSVNRLFWEEEMWPIGSRFESTRMLSSVDFVLYTYTGERPDEVYWREQAQCWCHASVEVVLIQMSSGEHSLVQSVYYCGDQSENIEDHDTFERLFINSLF